MDKGRVSKSPTYIFGHFGSYIHNSFVGYLCSGFPYCFSVDKYFAYRKSGKLCLFESYVHFANTMSHVNGFTLHNPRLYDISAVLLVSFNAYLIKPPFSGTANRSNTNIESERERERVQSTHSLALKHDHAA